MALWGLVGSLPCCASRRLALRQLMPTQAAFPPRSNSAPTPITHPALFPRHLDSPWTALGRWRARRGQRTSLCFPLSRNSTGRLERNVAVELHSNGEVASVEVRRRSGESAKYRQECRSGLEPSMDFREGRSACWRLVAAGRPLGQIGQRASPAFAHHRNQFERRFVEEELEGNVAHVSGADFGITSWTSLYSVVM